MTHHQDPPSRVRSPLTSVTPFSVSDPTLVPRAKRKSPAAACSTTASSVTLSPATFFDVVPEDALGDVLDDVLDDDAFAAASIGDAQGVLSATRGGPLASSAQNRAGPQGLRHHSVRLFWAFTSVVAVTFVVSVVNFASQSVLDCPEGTELVGGPPPQAFEAYCAIAETGGAVRHGPYRRWHAMSSAYKGSRLAPDVSLEGQYSFSEKTGVWKTRARNGRVTSSWVETPSVVALR